VEFYAEDAAGNAEAVTRVPVLVDLEAPTVELRIEPEGAVVNAAALTLSWSGDDGAGSGVASYWIEYTLEGPPWFLWRQAQTAGSGQFDAVDGAYAFRVAGFDAAGRRSPDAQVGLRVALSGALRLRVVDDRGNFVENLTVTAPSLGAPVFGNGTVLVAGLPPGPVTLRIEAPGFPARTVDAVVTAGQESSLGDIVMSRTAQGGGVDLTAAYLVLASLGVLAFAFHLRTRRKWERRKKEREAEDAARRRAERSRKRR
jgi:hypothetical protein